MEIIKIKSHFLEWDFSIVPSKKFWNLGSTKFEKEVVSTKNALSMGKTVRCAWILPLLQNRTAVVLVLVLNLSQKKCSYCYNSLDRISKPLMRRRKNKMRLWNIFLLTLAICLICAGPVSQQWEGSQVSRNQFERDQPATKTAQQIQRILTTTWKRIPCEYLFTLEPRKRRKQSLTRLINPIKAMHLLELSRKVLGWHLSSWASSLVWWQASQHHHQHYHPHHHKSSGGVGVRLILRCWGKSSILCQQNSDAL